MRAWRRGLQIFILILAVGGASPCFPDQIAKGFTISKPEWRSGDSWNVHYRDALNERGISEPSKRLDGTDCFIVETTSDTRYFAKEDLNWVTFEHNGRITNRAFPSTWWFMWPLELGKKWVTHLQFMMFGDIIEYDEIVEVDLEMDAVTVPAGTFRAIKINKGYSISENHVEAWYCPEIKNFVKVVHHRPNIFLEELYGYHFT